MKKAALYDTVGTLFEQFTEASPQRALDIRTIKHMAGDVRGRRVLDLACGYGYFGREALAQGAAQAVGVDLSEKMIQLAREKSAKNADSMTFYVRDVAELESLGEFDLVIAAWLFNYASSPEDLLKMAQAVERNLKPKGRLVAYTINPSFRLDKGNMTQYGLDILKEEPFRGGYRYQAEFLTTPRAPFTCYKWSRSVYEQALHRAGLGEIQWQKPRLLPSDRALHPSGFWDVFQKNCLQIGLTCTKPHPTVPQPAKLRHSGNRKVAY